MPRSRTTISTKSWLSLRKTARIECRRHRSRTKAGSPSRIESDRTIKSVERFEVLETFASGPIVINQRRDHFMGGPLKMWHGVGVFFLRDGKIVEWYDYTISMERA